MRPFGYLVHFHEQMRQALVGLEEYDTCLPDKRETEPDTQAGSTSKQDDAFEGIDSLFSISEALADMRLYIKFMEEQVMPIYNSFRLPAHIDGIGEPGLGNDLPEKIRWTDLAYLFRPGDLIYVPDLTRSRQQVSTFFSSEIRALQEALSGTDGSFGSSTGQGSRSSHTDQMIWRVYRPPHSYPSFGRCRCETCSMGRPGCHVACYHIDYDGQNYAAVGKLIIIPPFKGERDVTKLPCYPLRYANKAAEMLRVGKESGRKFVRHVDPARKYSFYRGWTLIRTPLGERVKDKTGKHIISPEHIESEVLVDFEQAFHSDPERKPDVITPEPGNHAVYVGIVSGEGPLKEWKDSNRSELVNNWEDMTVVEDNVDVLQMKDYIEKDPLLGTKSEFGRSKLNDDDLVLLPRRLFAYVLWERKFVQIDVKYVHFPDRTDKEKAFESLQISSEHKTLIESLVYSHFQKRKNESSVEIATQDLIRGKGKGVIILLFGAPGVGKTATAEALAQKFDKPLFPITCGDLGFTPESVENSLHEIFRLAHLWDCVLLLDEADVFISQRQRDDPQRNALVSVFLRMLEYYNGILFLTTNRPGVLDEAVKSRVHLNLRYNFLDEEQVTKIFELNIQRLKEIEDQASKAPGHRKLHIDEDDVLEFAKAHWRNHTDGIGRWNGRQIRNAFLIAASLAHYEGDVGKNRQGLQKQLTSKHFAKVERTTRLYDEYRASCVGDVTDSELAYDRLERSDIYTSNPGFSPSSSQPRRSQGYGQAVPPGPGSLARRDSGPSWQRPVQTTASVSRMPMGNQGFPNGGIATSSGMGMGMQMGMDPSMHQQGYVQQAPMQQATMQQPQPFVQQQTLAPQAGQQQMALNQPSVQRQPSPMQQQFVQHQQFQNQEYTTASNPGNPTNQGYASHPNSQQSFKSMAGGEMGVNESNFNMNMSTSMVGGQQMVGGSGGAVGPGGSTMMMGSTGADWNGTVRQQNH